MTIKDDLVQQLLELEAEILESEKRLKAGSSQNALVGSRYQDGVSTRLSALYSEQSSDVVARLKQQRGELSAQIENIPDEEYQDGW